MKEELIELLKENINVEGIAFGLIDSVLEEALIKVVADSENKLDDMLMASIYPILESEMKKLLKAQIEKL